ncbi:MAG: DNA-binding response regulator [Verrucomicrobia bacterium]|nr:DNA-binding response regulator [Verrucomicrobiota bacterium]
MTGATGDHQHNGTDSTSHDAPQSSTKKRVLIVDDHGVVRDGIRLLLESCGEFSVVGDAQNGLEAVEKVARLSPQAVVMDISMPIMNGIEATTQIKQKHPATEVVILSMYASSEYVFRALKAGARAYILKESVGRELIEALRAVCQGRRYMSPKIVDVMVDAYLWTLNGNIAQPPKSPVESLTQRERQVMQMVVEGRSSKEIGDTLHLTSNTVDTYRHRIMQKIGVKDMAGLIRFACADATPPPAEELPAS